MAALSGLLAAYGAWREWADKRLRMGETWKAAADLKEKLYGLETKFFGLALAPTVENAPTEADGATASTEADGTKTGGREFTSEFRDALREADAACVTIVRQETQSFFQSLTLPRADVASALTAAQQSAASLISGFGSKTSDVSSQTELTLKSKIRAVAEAKAALSVLRDQHAKKAQQLIDALARIASAEAHKKERFEQEKLAIEAQVGKIKREITEVEEELRKA